MPRISVDVRIRPDRTDAPKRRLEGLVLSGDQKSIEFRVTETQHNFVFNRIYKEDTSQPAVFSNSVQPIVEGALEGYNGCVFAYGQTGAGLVILSFPLIYYRFLLFNNATAFLNSSKTFTMSGPLDSSNDADYGIVARVIAEMFRLSFKSNDAFSFRLSVLEIYNETLFDLLLNTGAMAGGGGDLPLTAFNSTIASDKEPKLTIIELDSGVVVPNLRIMPVTSPREAINLLLDAQANRAIAEHQLNARSSRSHVIYTFYVTRSSQTTHHTTASTPTAFSSSNAAAVNAVESDPIVHQSKIHLVDLAGSERVHKTGSKGTCNGPAAFIKRGNPSNIFFLEP